MKRSSGILVYKVENGYTYVLLTHMGGPYWSGIDKKAWSIPKGEYKKSENAIECAKREFKEETNIEINNNLIFLGSHKVSNNKLAIIFLIEKNADLSNFKSNCFELEYPKGSGKKQKFPEMDQIKWFKLDEAKEYILPNQIYFINKLERKIKRT